MLPNIIPADTGHWVIMRSFPCPACALYEMRGTRICTAFGMWEDDVGKAYNGTFVCPTEIIAFSDRADEFKRIKCAVVAASTDSHFCHFAWINIPRKQGGLGNMEIPLLSDKSMKIAKDYGILDEDTGVPFRGLFIIDANGILRQMTINDLPVGRSVDETLRLVQAFQFVDEHGEVCPAGWQPGKKTMKPDAAGVKDYFESVN